jgi:hypothetical protein
MRFAVVLNSSNSRDICYYQLFVSRLILYHCVHSIDCFFSFSVFFRVAQVLFLIIYLWCFAALLCEINNNNNNRPMRLTCRDAKSQSNAGIFPGPIGRLTPSRLVTPPNHRPPMDPSLACTPVILLHPEVENPGKKPGAVQRCMSRTVFLYGKHPIWPQPVPKLLNRWRPNFAHITMSPGPVHMPYLVSITWRAVPRQYGSL